MAIGSGFNINSFAQALPHGGARANLFQVQISTPSGLGVSSKHDDVPGKFTLVAKSTTIPPSTIEPVEVPFFGRNFRLPGGRTFDDWSTMITNDEDFKVRDFFEQWSDGINGHSTNKAQNNLSTIAQGGGVLGGTYTTDARVTQYGKDGNAVREYKMIDAWPHTIGEISLDWAENGTVEEFEVTWAFSWWESVAIQDAASTVTKHSGSFFR